MKEQNRFVIHISDYLVTWSWNCWWYHSELI